MSHDNQNDPAKQTHQSQPEGRTQDQGSTNGFNGNGFGAAPVAGSSREQVMIEFQQSMLAITRSFLEAQQQVMMAYLGQTSPQNLSQPQFSGQTQAYAQPPVYGEPAPYIQPVGPGHPAQAACVQPTGYVQPAQAAYVQPAYVQPAPQAMVEQGFDVQSAQYKAAPEAYQAGSQTYQTTPSGFATPETQLQQAAPPAARAAVEPVAPPVAAHAAASAQTSASNQAPASAESDAPTPSAEALVETLIDIVSDRTGYPREMLDPTLDMEADLGIDSIKKIEILNALRKLLPAAKQAQIEESMERIATIKTLQGVMDWIRDEFGDQASTTTAAGAAPTSVASAPSAVVPALAAPVAVTPAASAPLAVAAAPSPSAPPPSPGIIQPSAIKPKARLHGSAVSQPEPGVVAFTVAFGPDSDLYLNDHKFNQVPVMPMAAALELMAAAACSVYPGYTLSSVENLDIPAGITFEAGTKELTVVVRDAQSVANGADAEHVSVSTAVTTGGATGRVHFKARIDLVRSLNGKNWTPSAETLAAFPAVKNPAGRLPTIDEIYGKLMFHGPLMQGICQVTELGDDGISGVLRSSDIKRCVRSANGDNWIIDPILLDSAMQLAGIWARHYHDIMVLPTGFTRLRLYKNGTDSSAHANLTGKIHVPVEYDKGQLRCDLAIYDDGKPVMIVEGLGGVGSKSFNKLAAQS